MMLDPLPRVILAPGLGLFGLGRSKKDAAIAADIAENTVATITDAEAIGRFEALPEADLFDMEYWSLEQAKLGAAKEKPLAGQIAVVTGGAGAIGAATAKLFKDSYMAPEVAGAGPGRRGGRNGPPRRWAAWGSPAT